MKSGPQSCGPVLFCGVNYIPLRSDIHSKQNFAQYHRNLRMLFHHSRQLETPKSHPQIVVIEGRLFRIERRVPASTPYSPLLRMIPAQLIQSLG